MKKLVTLAITLLTFFAFSSFAFADTHVSQMATTNGGQSVAQCAQQMDRGVSECAQMTECTHEM